VHSKALLSAVAVVLASACQDGPHGAPTSKQAVQITNREFAKDSPQVNLREFTVQTADKGDRWRVVYDVPGGSTGTPVIFDVDKKSGKIVYVHRNQ
jgi:hypothetical protein